MQKAGAAFLVSSRTQLRGNDPGRDTDGPADAVRPVDKNDTGEMQWPHFETDNNYDIPVASDWYMVFAMLHPIAVTLALLLDLVGALRAGLTVMATFWCDCFAI